MRRNYRENGPEMRRNYRENGPEMRRNYRDSEGVGAREPHRQMCSVTRTDYTPLGVYFVHKMRRNLGHDMISNR